LSRPSRNRSIINGILWRLRCGAPWRDVPPKYGSWNTIYRRFRRWSEAGVWETVAVTLAEVMADSGHYSIDSTTVRAHVSAAGGKGGLIDALLAARGAGSPVSFTAWLMPSDDRSPSILTVGEAADCKAYDALIDLPERAPHALLADKGYDADAIRADLVRTEYRGRHSGPVKPPREDRT
jgi:transposase